MIAQDRTRRILILLSALAVIGGLAGAAYWPALKAWFAPPPAPEKLTLAVTNYPGAGLVHLAAAQAYFAAEGLAVTLQSHTSGRSALDAVIANQAQIATVGDTPVMFSLTKQVPLAVVATIAQAVRSHGIIARRDRGIASAADLKGKTIGVTLGTDGHFLLHMILANQGIAAGEVTLKNTRPEQVATMLTTGSVDAIVAWEPWLSQASKAAGANSVAIYPEQGFGFGFHLVGQREFVRAHPLAMQKLLRALLRAERFLEQQPQVARAILIEATRSDPAFFDVAWPNFDARLMLRQGLLTMLEDQARWAIGNGLTDAREAPNFLEAIYLDALLAVKPQAVSVVR